MLGALCWMVSSETISVLASDSSREERRLPLMIHCSQLIPWSRKLLIYRFRWVCIGAQPQTVTASFEYITSAPAVTVPDPTSYVTTTFPAINSSFTALPTQAGMPTNCQSYYQAKPVGVPYRICRVNELFELMVSYLG